VFDAIAKLTALPPAERRFLALAWLLAPPTSALLAMAGFGSALSWVRSTSREVHEEPDGLVSVERGEELVRIAFDRALSTRGCLPRSVVQFLLHRWLAPAPKLVIGVKREAVPLVKDSPTELLWSLDAHAWIERAEGPARSLGYVPILAFSDTSGLWRAGTSSEAGAT
jgi:hypothetical protein